MTAEYLPGDRWLVATGDAMAYLEGSAARAVALWRVLSANGSAVAAVEVLLADVLRNGAAGLAGLGGFVIAVSEPSGVRVLCRQIDDVAIRGADTAVTAVSGSGLVGWAEIVTPHPCAVTVGDPGARELLPVPGGVVRAGSMRWRPTQGRRLDRDAPVAGPGASALATVDPAAAAMDAGPEVPQREHSAAVDLAAAAMDAAPEAPPLEHSAALEETRYELGVDLDDIPEPAADSPEPAAPEGSVTDDRWSPDDAGAAVSDVAVSGAAAADDAAGPSGDDASGPTPPITAVPVAGVPVTAAPTTAVPSAGVPIAAVPGLGRDGDRVEAWPGPAADHDGLTQLAEDLPIGFTPPPVLGELSVGTVLAVLCPSGHANAPHSTSCRLCGQPIGMTEPVPVQRPVLARLRLSTGQVVDVDRPVVVGRAPYAGRVAASELPHLVTVPSPHQDISRAHTQIRVTDWQLVVTDLDSTNGTTVRPPGRPAQRLHPGQEVVVEPGWSVELGDGVSLVIEAAP